MIIRKEVECVDCGAEYKLEFNIEITPDPPEFCAFCQEQLPFDEDFADVSLLIGDDS